MSDADQLLEDDQLQPFLTEPSRIAVLGMKPEGPAGSVPDYLARRGFEIVPVNPKYDAIGGRRAVDRVDEIDRPVRIVEVFRRSEAVASHVGEILAMDPLPELVWLQLGIRNREAAERLVEGGVSVVQDRCMKVEYERLSGDIGS